jgi:protein SCO1
MRLTYALALVAALSGPVMAHSLEEVEETLQGREKYFQAVDLEAPGFALQDSAGHGVGLADFRGKVVILNFIYTHCPDVCPLHAERLVEIQQMINASPMKEQVELVTITTDPKQDTPQVLRDYGASHGLEKANWALLTARSDQAEDSTRKVAEAYGLKFTAADGMQMHGVVTHVIDQDGRLRARFHGLKFEPVNLVVFVNALVNKIQKPHPHGQPSFWDKVKGWVGL